MNPSAQHMSCVLVVALQGMRANKWKVLKTIAEIKLLAERQIRLSSKGADTTLNGAEGSKESGNKRQSADATPSSKRARTNEQGEDDIESPAAKKVGFENLNVPYILWGNSQKTQVAGVGRLSFRVAVVRGKPCI